MFESSIQSATSSQQSDIAQVFVKKMPVPSNISYPTYLLIVAQIPENLGTRWRFVLQISLVWVVKREHWKQNRFNAYDISWTALFFCAHLLNNYMFVSFILNWNKFCSIRVTTYTHQGYYIHSSGILHTLIRVTTYTHQGYYIHSSGILHTLIRVTTYTHLDTLSYWRFEVLDMHITVMESY